MADPTFTPEQILGEVRVKYPEYASKTDMELAQALTMKYPTYEPVFRGFLAQRSRQMPQEPATSYPLSEAAGDVGKGALRIGLPAAGAALGFGAGGPVGAMAIGTGADMLARKITGAEGGGPGEMALSAGTSLLGGLPAKGAGMFGRTVTPENQLVMGQAARLGIPLTAAENTGRAGLAQTYANVGRYPSSATRVEAYGLEKRGAIQRAAESMPGTMPKDLVTAGEGVAGRIGEVQAAQSQAAEETVSRFGDSLGRAKGREEFGTEFQKEMWRINLQRRANASQIYDRVENQLGDRAQQAPTLYGVASAMSQKEQALRGVQNPTLANRSGGLARTTGPDMGAKVDVGAMPPSQISDLMRTGGGDIAAGGGSVTVADLPTEFVKIYKLDQPRELTFGQMRDIQSRLGSMIRNSKDDYTKNKLGDLRDAITTDIRLLANSDPAALADLHRANNYFGKEVAAHFGRRTPMRGLLDESQVDRVTNQLMNVDSPVRVKEVMKLAPPDLQATYRASFMARLHDEGLNPATGQWDPARYLRATDRYTDDTMRAMLGPKFNEFDKMRTTLQRDLQPGAQEPIYGQMLKKDEAQIPGRLLTFVKNNNHEDVKAVLGTLGPAADDAKAAMWTQLMKESTTPDSGQFSIQRFMSRTKELDPRTREILLGAQGAQSLGELENVLRRIQTVGSFGLNTSETARGVLGAGQLEGSFRLALHALTGTMGPRDGLVALGALLRPNIMARFLTSERGINLLTRGLTVSPGSKQAITLASELAAFGTKYGLE